MPTSRLRRIARTTLGASGCPDAELSILITDDARIQVLNREWRGKDRPTDVISFPQEEGETPVADATAAMGPRVLGDVVISLETAARQAERYGHGLEAEVRRLLVHGILHLLGFEHVHGGRQAAKMKREEARLLDVVARELGGPASE